MITDSSIGWKAIQTRRGTARILASIMLAAAIPVLLFGGWAIYQTAQREDARRAAYETAMRVADHVAAELDQELDIAEALVASSALDGPDLGAFRTEAQRTAKARPLWEVVTLFDRAGAIVADLLRSPGEARGPPQDPENLREAIRSREPVVGSFGAAAEKMPGGRTIPLRVPVLRDDELRFVFSVGLRPSSIASALRGAGAPEGWVGTLADSNGRIIARSAPEDYQAGGRGSAALRAAVARGEEGFYSGRTLEGVEVESVYRALPGTGGWSAHFAIPSHDLDAPVRHSLAILVSGGMIALVVAAGLGALVARELAQQRRQEAERASLAVQASEDRAAVAVDAAELGTWCWDGARDEVSGSPRTARWLGLSGAEGADEGRWTSAAFLARIHPDDRPAFRRAVDACLSAQGGLDVEFRVGSPERGARWLKAMGRASNGGPAAVIHGVIADIDAEKRSAAERRELLRRLADAQENEQRRIARELHDQVGQTVTGLALALKSLESSAERIGAPPAMLDQVRYLQDLANTIGRDIHRASSDLRPTALDDLGLRRALAAHVAEWSRRFDVEIDLQWHGSEERLTADVETAIYRVVQEAITNVVKHASAHTVGVVIERQQSALRLVVEDDGKGIASECEGPAIAPGQAPPLGLSGMRERISLIDGELRIESERGGGTTLFVWVPLDNAA